jgi:MFS family permease
MAAFSLGPLLGPVIGPVAGGFLSQAKGWRWVFWVLSILAGFNTAMMLLFMPETFAPVLLARKTAKLRKETGNTLLRSKLDAGLSATDYFKRGIVRPLRMLVFSPIVLIFALYMAVIYSYLYLLFTSMTEVFEEFYGFSTGTVGLSFLGIGVGSLLGLAIFSSLSDRHIKKRAAATEGGEMKPEYRLHLLPYGAIILPAGFFIYGWTAEKHVHWIVPILGTCVIGVGNLLCFMAISLCKPAMTNPFDKPSRPCYCYCCSCRGLGHILGEVWTADTASFHRYGGLLYHLCGFGPCGEHHCKIRGWCRPPSRRTSDVSSPGLGVGKFPPWLCCLAPYPSPFCHPALWRVPAEEICHQRLIARAR